MKLKPSNHTVSRGGFTLVEMLVVIFIIAILVSLTSAAVFKAFEEGNKVENRNNITQLSAALDSFKGKYGVYPPSRIRLGYRPNDTCYPGLLPMATKAEKELDIDSIAFIQKMFPNCYKNWLGPGAGTGFPWAATVTDGQPGIVLEGEECLVFFLGGIQQTNPPACLGFSVDTTNPLKAGGSRVGPYYDFKSAHLVLGSTKGFLGYNDPYGRVYAYFSSYNTKNGYARFSSLYMDGGDCASLGVAPYTENATAPLTYHKPSTFQIISAGQNGLFGAGGLWPPVVATNEMKDDMANFHPRLLGSP